MTLPPASSSAQSGNGEAPAQESSPAPVLFVYVKIPVGRGRIDRGRIREEKIDQALREKAVGTVSGWGSSLGDAWVEGSCVVEFHRIDIEVTDLAAAKVVLRQLLPALGVAIGTELHYKKDGRDVLDVYSSSGWCLEQALADPRPASGGQGIGR